MPEAVSEMTRVLRSRLPPAISTKPRRCSPSSSRETELCSSPRHVVIEDLRHGTHATKC